MNIKEYVYVSLLTAAAVVMGIIESSLPPFFAFAPGAKVGLANLVMIIAVFTLRWRQVWVMQILRLLITALFTGFSVFLYSFAGGILSLLAMYLMKQFGPKLVSMICPSLLAKTTSVMLYLPWLAFFGILAGFAIGIAGNQLITRVKPIQELFIKESKQWT